MCEGKGELLDEARGHLRMCLDCAGEGEVPLGRYTELEFKKAKRDTAPPDTDPDPKEQI